MRKVTDKDSASIRGGSYYTCYCSQCGKAFSEWYLIYGLITYYRALGVAQNRKTSHEAVECAARW